MTILSMLYETLTRKSDEVEMVYDAEFKAAPTQAGFGLAELY
jgi:hypothetical protein